MSLYLSICLPVYVLSVHLFVCLSGYLSVSLKSSSVSLVYLIIVSLDISCNLCIISILGANVSWLLLCIRIVPDNILCCICQFTVQLLGE